jgi:hypothetical protein
MALVQAPIYVFDDKTKSIICQYVHHVMADQDWFGAVAAQEQDVKDLKLQLAVARCTRYALSLLYAYGGKACCRRGMFYRVVMDTSASERGYCRGSRN